MSSVPVVLRKTLWKHWLRTVLTGTLLALGACGGGSGSSANAPTGSLSFSLTDGPSTDFAHAYITIMNVMLHTSAATTDIAQPGWVTLALPAPLTIDLNHLDNGVLARLLTNAGLPSATYGQIRLGLYAWDGSPPQSSATAINAVSSVNGVTVYTPLQYNATIVEADGSQYPLEFPSQQQGLVLNGSFTVQPGKSLNLAVEVDVGDDVLQFNQGARHAYILNPALRYYDLAQSGTITGRIDTSACTPTCTNFVVKAESPSGNGSYYQVARWTDVDAQGNFTLYPVPVNSSQQTYDIVVCGRSAQTMIIQSVPVIAGSTPSSGTATVVSSTALPVASAIEYTATTSTTHPSAGWAQFYQTVSGKAYEIRFRQTNPITGTFQTNAPEPLVAGNILVGAYANGGAIALTPVAPLEGAGNYQVWFNAPNYARTAAVNLLTAAAPTITPPVSLLQGSAVATFGAVAGSLTVSSSARWTNAQLILTSFGNIVSTQDVSNLVTAGGNYSFGAVPAGSPTQPFAQGFYYAYLRLWNTASAHPDQITIVPINGSADLRTSASATLSATTLY
jgi:hypothetical protein